MTRHLYRPVCHQPTPVLSGYVRAGWIFTWRFNARTGRSVMRAFSQLASPDNERRLASGLYIIK
jgi:hypothetical protein